MGVAWGAGEARGQGAPGANAQGRTVYGFALPARKAPELARQVERVTQLVAGKIGGTVESVPEDADIATALRRAQALADKGALDEAAVAFDVAIENAARTPHSVRDHDLFLSAHIARTAIALARSEATRVEQLLERVIRYDPTFALLPTEESPRLRAALDRVRARLGGRPALRAQDLGEACGVAQVVVVGRQLESGATELFRWDGCHREGVVLLSSGTTEEAVALALEEAGMPQPPPKIKEPPLALAAAPTPPSQDRSVADAPFYERAWFWALVGAVVVGGGVGVWAATRGGGSEGWDPVLRR